MRRFCYTCDTDGNWSNKVSDNLGKVELKTSVEW